ncbi:dynamin-2A [Iris pallida]|uniref:Dynamin-2A n=1 Tax=Iris pallida TaxID=29817 RepID=A0AAX6HD50_IRIPA|nr:dynamin-2A [Iris pallida]
MLSTATTGLAPQRYRIRKLRQDRQLRNAGESNLYV